MAALPPLRTPADDPNGVLLRLSAQRALWAAVGQHVQSIYVGYNGTTVRFLAIVDVDLPDDERDALSVAAAEIIADYPSGWGLAEAIEVTDERPDDLWLVYQRYRRM